MWVTASCSLSRKRTPQALWAENATELGGLQRNLLPSGYGDTYQAEQTNPDRPSSSVVSPGKQKHQNCYDHQD